MPVLAPRWTHAAANRCCPVLTLRSPQVSWDGDKPIVGGRYAMWGTPGSGFDDPVSLTRKLRTLSKDPRNAASYSLIPVHVWTHRLDGRWVGDRALGDGKVIPVLRGGGGREDVMACCVLEDELKRKCRGGGDFCLASLAFPPNLCSSCAWRALP